MPELCAVWEFLLGSNGGWGGFRQGSFVDPLADGFDLFGGEWVACAWHLIAFVGVRIDFVVERALVGFAGFDDETSVLATLACHHGVIVYEAYAGQAVVVVASGASLIEDGLHLGFVVDGGWVGLWVGCAWLGGLHLPRLPLSFHLPRPGYLRPGRSG